MGKFFSIEVTNSPKAFIDYLNYFASEGINIEAFAGWQTNGKAYFYFVPSDEEKTAQWLGTTDYTWKSYDCFYVQFPNQPGVFSTWYKQVAEAGVDFDACFGTPNGYHVVATNDNAKAIEISKQLNYYYEPVFG